MMGFRGLFEKELLFLKNNLIHYLNYWPENPEWRPTPSSYSFLTLANHLYTLPAAYNALFRGSSTEELMSLWGGPWHGKSREDLRSILISGVSSIKEFLNDHSSDLEKHIPWPFGDPLPLQEHLLNLLTHMYHHRGQMHLYLKQLGAEVDTGTVYAGSF